MYNYTQLTHQGGRMNVLIAGATGYAGQQLLTLLSSHPEVTKLYLTSNSQFEMDIQDIYPHMSHKITQRLIKTTDALTTTFMLTHHIDVCFLALPHGQSSQYLECIEAPSCLFIDLSADLRLKDSTLYETWHGHKTAESLLSQSVYGLSEWYRDAIKDSKLIANPGCYATATLLAILPLIQNEFIQDPLIFVDGKSGISGAGRQARLGNLFGESSENITPYKTGTHQHTPEIEETLNGFSNALGTFQIHFSPSVVPMTRGLLSTIYAKAKPDVTSAQIVEAFKVAYSNRPFIRLLDRPPATKNVRGSNYADIWVLLDERTGSITSMCAIDNLMKGAAGQAIQNMNIHFGFDETLGLEQMPLYP